MNTEESKIATYRTDSDLLKIFILVMFSFCMTGLAIANNNSKTDMDFRTSDNELQKLFGAAEEKAKLNIVEFAPNMKVLVEGGGYGNAWIETQPMGGEMYAKHNLDVALNNQLVFILSQRKDGRLPGMVISTDDGSRMIEEGRAPEWMTWMPEPKILADFEMLQGYCFPDPAWRMYFWIGKDKDYLQKLYNVLEGHDQYLWNTRDSNNDGILESWCEWDTGEDGSIRYEKRNAPIRWPFDFAPGAKRDEISKPGRFWFRRPPEPDKVLVPFASMDIMSYSYDGRNTLAKISEELGNGKAQYWNERAEEVQQRIIESLWDPSRNACFDRDRNGEQLPELIHNNLRAMYHGTFTQSMADKFIKHHLLNPNEFWTPLPLPSIAFNDPLYRNKDFNNWSGQPQGLTYQRAIRALENYGHFTEVTLLGQKLLPVLISNDYKFSQQLDPQTGKDTAKRKRDGYGPMMLAAMEYISRMHGIYLDVSNDQVWWSSIGDKDFTYTQKWGENSWSMESKNGEFTASLNGKDLFACAGGARVVTDLKGGIIKVVGIIPEPRQIALNAGDTQYKQTVKPNNVYSPNDGKLIKTTAAPFDYPYRKSDREKRHN